MTYSTYTRMYPRIAMSIETSGLGDNDKIIFVSLIGINVHINMWLDVDCDISDEVFDIIGISREQYEELDKISIADAELKLSHLFREISDLNAVVATMNIPFVFKMFSSTFNSSKDMLSNVMFFDILQYDKIFWSKRKHHSFKALKDEYDSDYKKTFAIRDIAQKQYSEIGNVLSIESVSSKMMMNAFYEMQQQRKRSFDQGKPFNDSAINIIEHEIEWLDKNAKKQI